MKVVLGPAAREKLAAASEAVPDAIEKPSVPSPVTLENVTVRVVVPVPETVAVPAAEPVLLTIMSALASVTADAPIYVTVYVTGPLRVIATDGEPMLMLGPVLSTVKVALGPAARERLPAVSDALPEAMLIPSVPSPLIPVISTVRLPVPEPVTFTVPVAVPVVLSVIMPGASKMLSAPVYVTVYVTGPEFVSETDGAPMLSVGAVLSTTNVALGPAAADRLVAESTATPEATEMPREPSPVMPLIVTVRVLVPLPVMLTVPVAVPEEFRMISAGAILTADAPVKVRVYVTGPDEANAADGPLIATAGGVLSTVKVELGPAAGALLHVLSSAVPAAIEIPSVPSPEMLLTVTVRVVLPVPETLTTPLAVPVLLSVMFAALSETFSALP